MQRLASKRKDDAPPPEKPKKPDPKRKPKAKKSGNTGQFQPGHKLSGGARGPIGKLAKRFLTAAVIDRLQEVEKIKGGPAAGIMALHRLADVLVRNALGGDQHAINAVFDRVEGKPIQAVELSGRDGKAFVTISGEMSPEEAARAYAQTLIETDPEEDNGGVKK